MKPIRMFVGLMLALAIAASFCLASPVATYAQNNSLLPRRRQKQRLRPQPRRPPLPPRRRRLLRRPAQPQF